MARGAAQAEFEDVQAALDAFRACEIDAGVVMREFGHVDGIERSIALAKAQRVNVKTRADVENAVTDGVDLDT